MAGGAPLQSSPQKAPQTFLSIATSLYGDPFESSLSDNGMRFCSNLAMAVYKLLGVRKVATTRTTPTAMNGGVERVNHTMAQMLAMVVNERQDD